MSFECMAWALKQKVGNGIAKAVLLHLADRVNKDSGTCIPKIKTIASDAEFSEESVKRAIRLLKEKKLIEVIHRFHEGQQIPNAYKLGPHAHLCEDVGQIPPWALLEPTLGSNRPTEPVKEPVRTTNIPTPAGVAHGQEEIPLSKDSFKPQEQQPSPKLRATPSLPVELPSDFKPSPAQVAFAKEQGLDIEACLTSMRRWAIGKKRAKWTAVFNQFLKPDRFGSNVIKAQPKFTPYKPIDTSTPITFED